MVDVRNHSQPWFGIGFAQKSMVVKITMVYSTMVNHGSTMVDVGNHSQPWFSIGFAQKSMVVRITMVCSAMVNHG